MSRRIDGREMQRKLLLSPTIDNPEKHLIFD